MSIHKLTRSLWRASQGSEPGCALHFPSEKMGGHMQSKPHQQFSFSSLQIIKDRIFHQESRPRLFWNMLPGGLLALPEFSTSPNDFPFYYLQQGTEMPYLASYMMSHSYTHIFSLRPVVFPGHLHLQATICPQAIRGKVSIKVKKD